jgi:hypothetical protein
MDIHIINLIKKLEANQLRCWIEQEKLYIEGDAKQICRCIESTRAKHIKHNGYLFSIEQVVNRLNGRAEIKFSIDEIVY